MMKEELRAAVAERLGVEMESVRVNEVMKNNGKVMTALVVMDDGKSGVYPNVYIDKEMEDWRVGRMSLDELVDDVVERYKAVTDQGLPAVPKVSREMILDGAIIQVVNAEKNADQLNDIPHRRFLDLAAIVRCVVDLGGIAGQGSMKVTYTMIQGFGISEDDLFERALQNTVEKYPLRFMPMGQMMSELVGGSPEDFDGDMKSPLYVLTNQQKMNGAAVMFWPEKIGEIADKIGDDVYVLPSSIHEVLLTTVHGCALEVRDLQNMVREINATVVDQEEVLSDNVYVYRRETRDLIVA